MEKDAKKNILFLVLAGFLLVAVNATIWMGAQNGQLSPIDNRPLWGVFVSLSTCSLLWAVSLLGLQPMGVALSYMAGGFLAYQGVRLLPEMNIAELTTAGATYGAFGALAVGNATTKVRLAFFRKGQKHFVFIIVALLAMDGFLNSRVSNAGWNVILNALVLPFVLAGAMIGLIWLVRVAIGRGASRKTTETLAEDRSGKPVDEAADNNTMQLVITVPDRTEVAAEPEEMTLAMEVVEPVPAAADMCEVPIEKQDPVVEKTGDDLFFPLEIDKDDAFIPPSGDSSPMDLAAMVVEEAPEPSVETAPFQPLEVEPVAASETRPLEADKEVPEKKKSPDDWLSGHLDLLRKIKTDKNSKPKE